MNIATYMGACLFDPTHGFYPTRDPLGAEGDFITAPEISQMFGEMIGLWCVQTWRDMGSPARVQLIELGPGRGIMMSDILRAARLDPDFIRAVNVTLIEASPALESVQGRTLANSPCPVAWVDGLQKAPNGPSIIIGNEFIDCLPIRQFIRKEQVWHERVVALDPQDENSLIFAITPVANTIEDFSAFEEANENDLIEICPASQQLIDSLQERFIAHEGRALFIDYGPAQSETGDTLQALAKHKKVDPLAEPGEADLTARVDFGALARFAKASDTDVFGPTTQALFLSQMGIETRAAKLAAQSAHKDGDTASKIARQFHRLTDSSEMGNLFKVICFQSSGLSDPAGFLT